jgi:hypothetical protein
MTGSLHRHPIRDGGDAVATTRSTCPWTQVDHSRPDGPAGAGLSWRGWATYEDQVARSLRIASATPATLTASGLSPSLRLDRLAPDWRGVWTPIKFIKAPSQRHLPVSPESFFGGIFASYGPTGPKTRSPRCRFVSRRGNLLGLKRDVRNLLRGPNNLNA